MESLSLIRISAQYTGEVVPGAENTQGDIPIKINKAEIMTRNSNFDVKLVIAMNSSSTNSGALVGENWLQN